MSNFLAKRLSEDQADALAESLREVARLGLRLCTESDPEKSCTWFWLSDDPQTRVAVTDEGVVGAANPRALGLAAVNLLASLRSKRALP